MLSGRSLCAPIPPRLGPPWSTPTLLRSLSLWSGTKEATHLAPGRWGCARAPPGKLQVRHPRGPQVRLGRCVVQSGSSAPPGGWQPGHRGGRLETAGRGLGAAGQLPQTATGVSLCAHRPQLRCFSHLPLGTSSHHLWEAQWSKGPGITLHQKKRRHNPSAHLSRMLRGMS